MRQGDHSTKVNNVYNSLNTLISLYYVYACTFNINVDNTQKCKVHNSTLMTCPAPHVSLLPTGVDIDNLEDSLDAPHLNKPDFQFYLGLDFEGAPQYRNITEQNAHIGIIKMFKTPKLEVDVSDNLIPFRIYEGQKSIINAVRTNPQFDSSIGRL